MLNNRAVLLSRSELMLGCNQATIMTIIARYQAADGLSIQQTSSVQPDELQAHICMPYEADAIQTTVR